MIARRQILSVFATLPFCALPAAHDRARAIQEIRDAIHANDGDSIMRTVRALREFCDSDTEYDLLTDYIYEQEFGA